MIFFLLYSQRLHPATDGNRQTCNQTLGRAQGILQKRRERIVGARGVKDTTKKNHRESTKGLIGVHRDCSQEACMRLT